MLHEFVAVHRSEIIARCRAKVAGRTVPSPTDAEVEHGVPVFLEQLVAALRLGVTGGPNIGQTAREHGRDLLRKGFSVGQVVHDYGDVCQSITELAVQTGASISSNDFRLLNRCLDEAIAGAVTEYGDAHRQGSLDAETARESQRLGYFAHELRNLINTSIVAFEVLRTGNVGVGGSTGVVLHRSLTGLRALVGRSLAEVRLTQEVQHMEPLVVAELFDEVALAAALEADARGLTLRVKPVAPDVAIEGDRQVLAAVITNLLQNAFKFTQPHTVVTVGASVTADRVRIEVQDECRGLPEGDVDALFRPFEQRDTDRSGMGLGLAFSRWAVEAHHGANLGTQPDSRLRVHRRLAATPRGAAQLVCAAWQVRKRCPPPTSSGAPAGWGSDSRSGRGTCMQCACLGVDHRLTPMPPSTSR